MLLLIFILKNCKVIDMLINVKISINFTYKNFYVTHCPSNGQMPMAHPRMWNKDPKITDRKKGKGSA